MNNERFKTLDFIVDHFLQNNISMLFFEGYISRKKIIKIQKNNITFI